MLKKALVAVAVLLVVAGGLLYFRAQSIFSSDLVRTQVAAQLANALGQPVEIGSIGASIFPRVTMVLSDVRIGTPATITVTRLDVGASARALLSRRIDQASLHVDGARIELPLPPFAFGGGQAPPEGDAAVTLGSIEEIALTGIEIVSGGRTLRGDVRVVPQGAGLRIDRMSLRLDETAVEVTGEITNVQGPAGRLSLRAASLDMLALQAFASDFAAGAGLETSPTPGAGEAPRAPVPSARSMDLSIDMQADRATFGTLALGRLKGSARLTDEQLAISDMGFELFEGTYTGTLTLGLSDSPAFELRGTLADVSMAALTAWAGQPGTMTGRLAATLDAAGAGVDADSVIASTRGTARMDVVQGTVEGLALVRTIVVASSMRTGSAASAASGGGSEAFSRMGASFSLGGGTARTNDLRFESNDLLLDGEGTIGLDGTAVDLTGRVQLSEALTAEAGRDLVRYTQEGGRVTVPVSISGSAGNLSVRLEAADVLRRAITNKATEEAGDAIRRGLGGLFGR